MERPALLVASGAAELDMSSGRAALGSSERLRRLFDGHYGSVWRLLGRLGVPQGSLDDSAQEVFWVAARRLSDIRPGSEQAFLYGVALRVVAYMQRQRRALPPLLQLDEEHEPLDPAPSPEQALEQRRARAVLDSVLDRLPHELRVVFVLFELEGLSVKDIADLEGVPIGTASSRLRRAREEFSAIAHRVRLALARQGGDPR